MHRTSPSPFSLPWPFFARDSSTFILSISLRPFSEDRSKIKEIDPQPQSPQFIASISSRPSRHWKSAWRRYDEKKDESKKPKLSPQFDFEAWNESFSCWASMDSMGQAIQIVTQIPARGIKELRDKIASGIEACDGFPANPNNIFLTNGASPAVHMIILLLIGPENDGILCPISQILFILLHLPSMVALIARFLIILMKKQVLAEANQQKIVKFCRKEGLVILADEDTMASVESEEATWSSLIMSPSHVAGYRSSKLLDFSKTEGLC
ncbi:hypothetical protein HAX54_046343 [Datura stramonium]|uniref:Uncharacterized protein n=1 Tax=Datura stramonium TaxID=4076 RepID=A0ABS8WIV4_DATST|nr:hypothetical protein [Datura stramonium]